MIVSIFSSINLKGEGSTFVNMLINVKEFCEYNIEKQKVGYEFMKKGNEMIKNELTNFWK